jgi:hypothetical protein
MLSVLNHFTTPLIVTTISVYSVLWPSDVMSRSGPLISSVICSVISFCDLSSVSLSRCLFYISLICLVCSLFYISLLSLSLCLTSCPSNTVFASAIEDTFSHGCIFRYFGFATIWLLRKLQIRTRPLSSNVHIWTTVYSENRCVGSSKSVALLINLLFD